MMRLNSILNLTISESQVRILNYFLIAVIVIVPLFMSYPFNINIYLAWEGSYRIFLGQIPSMDFYLPMGFVFWLLPALFFKIFGPNLFTLIIFQCFVNLITFLTFERVLRLLKVNYYVIFISTLVLALSYIILNFWPWYNNFVFVLQLVSIMFLLMARASSVPIRKYIYLIVAAGFSIFSFFTKQDAGGLTIMINCMLILYMSIFDRQYKQFFIFIIALIIWVLPFTLPFLSYDILYWFNIGQPPHYSRLNVFIYLNELFKFSYWIKFYILIIVLLAFFKYRSVKELFSSEIDMIFLIFILGILFQASVIQVTSYIPHYSYFYLHGCCFAYILSQIGLENKVNKVGTFILIVLFTVFLWSSDVWKYGLRIGKNILPDTFYEVPDNVVSKSTWKNSQNSIFDNRASWRLTEFKTLRNVYIPPETAEGMKKLIENLKGVENLKVLNLSELTMLAEEIGYEPLMNHPLWYHKNVAIFDKEIAEICEKISQHDYDIVLFEAIPVLNNFYPDEIHKCLKENYKLIDEFRAPRREKDSKIFVYSSN